MKKWTMWGTMGIVLVLGSLIVGAWGFVQVALTSPVANAESFTVNSNEPMSVALLGDVVYQMQVREAVAIDNCEVTGPDGQALPIKSLNKTENGWKKIYQFTTPSDGTYLVTCTAKTDGRSILVFPILTFLDYLHNPLMWVAVLMFIVGVVCANRQGAHTRAVRAAQSAQVATRNPTPPGSYPPRSYPPGSYPPGSYPPGSYPPGSYPPGSYPPGSYPQNPYSPGRYQG